MAGDFQRLESLLADAILASYLLALDSTRTETTNTIARAKIANLADDSEFINEEYGPNESDDEAARIGIPDLNLQLRFDVPPQEAIEYFKRKNIVTKKEFGDLRDEARSAAFTVGGVYEADVLQGFKNEIETALANGATQEAVVKKFKAILTGAAHEMLGDFHLETVFRTNMQTAYGVGRRRAFEEVADDLPFWEYSAVNDDRTRPAHKACDGLILPADHEFWATHFPPWGFNCRCSVIARADVPVGYDSENPTSGDYKLAYNAEGLPIAASDGIQVYPLSAGKFVGVPAQRGLRESIEYRVLNRSGNDKTTPDSGKSPQTPKTPPEDTYRTPEKVLAEVENIRFAKVELGRWYDYEGDLLQRATGTEDLVYYQIPSDLADLYYEGIRLHNHIFREGPIYESFSPADVVTAADWALTEELMVTRDFLYSMRPPPGGWDETWMRRISDTFDEEYDKVGKLLTERIRAGELDKSTADRIHRHEAWKNVSQKLGLRYQRRKLK